MKHPTVECGLMELLNRRLPRHLEALGFPALDRVTGADGVVTSVCFDLYGCIQYLLTPPAASGRDPQWFDAARIELVSGRRVMPLPGSLLGHGPEVVKGPAEKPVPR